MATGDVTAVIRADGWSADVTIEGRAGWLGSAAFDFGTPGTKAGSKLYFDVKSVGYSGGVLGTTDWVAYGVKVAEMPYGTYGIQAGTFTGTFTDGELITQSTSGATARVYGAGQGSTSGYLIVNNILGTADSSHTWTGGSSGATLLPAASPTVFTDDIRSISGNLVVRVGLSIEVHDNDKNGGAGTSGTDPKLTAAAGWASSGGNNSAAAAAVTCTNNSTLAYFSAFGHWDFGAGVIHADRVKSSFTAAFIARHGSGVDCVVLDATGQTSSAVLTSTVTAQTATLRTGTGLYALSHQATFALSGYTQGETIRLRARVYPKRGGSSQVMDTNGRSTQQNECLGWNQLDIICDKNSALDSIKYVATTGNDSTGDGSSGNPYATIAKAVSISGVNIVRLMVSNSTHNMGSALSRRTSSEWVIVEADSGATGVSVQVTTTKAYKCQRLRFRNLTIKPSAADASLDGEDAGNCLYFDGCVFDRNGQSNPTGAGVPVHYKSDVTYFRNVSGDLSVPKWTLGTFSTTRSATCWDGVTFEADSSAGSSINNAYYVVACALAGNTVYQKASGAAAPAQDGLIYEFNTCLDSTHASLNLLKLGTSAMTGVSVLGNRLKKTSGTGACVSMWGDDTASAATHVIFAHNTVLGGASGSRCNLFYNDYGTASYVHKGIFIIGNDCYQTNIKSTKFGKSVNTLTRSGTVATLTITSGHGYAVGDVIVVAGANQSAYNGTFAVKAGATSTVLTYDMASDPGASGSGSITCGPHPFRVGNFATLHGCNMRHNNFDNYQSATFGWVSGGIDYTTDTGVYVNAGSNDWTPDTGSTLLGRLIDPLISKDAAGHGVSTDATAAACVGALQPIPTISATFDGQAVADGGAVDVGTWNAGTKSGVFTVGGLTGAVATISDALWGLEAVGSVPATLTKGGATQTFTAACPASGHTPGDVLSVTWDGSGSPFDIEVDWQTKINGRRTRTGRTARWIRN